MNRRVFRGSRVNRDRREASFARSIIAEATRRHNADESERGKMTCVEANTYAHPECIKNTAILLQAGEIEVCPDCFGTGEVVRHVSDDVVTEAICLECNGRGWIE